MSRRLLKEELARRTLKILRVPGWPLRRTLYLVRLREAYSFRAVRHLVELAAMKIPELRLAGDGMGLHEMRGKWQ
jgi:hypothetical protein